MSASEAGDFTHAIAAFGAAATAALSNPAIAGEPEDQLRAPEQDDLLRHIVEGLTISIGALSGAGALTDSSAEGLPGDAMAEE